MADLRITESRKCLVDKGFHVSYTQYALLLSKVDRRKIWREDQYIRKRAYVIFIHIPLKTTY